MYRYFIFILATLSTVSAASASDLHTYADVKSAIQSGKRLSIFVDYSQCTLANGNKSHINISAVLTPSEIIINNDKEYMTSSVFHFTLSHPAFPGKGIYEFSKYTLTNGDDFTYSVQVVDPTNYQPLNDAMTFNCKLDVGVKMQAGG